MDKQKIEAIRARWALLGNDWRLLRELAPSGIERLEIVDGHGADANSICEVYDNDTALALLHAASDIAYLLESLGEKTAPALTSNEKWVSRYWVLEPQAVEEIVRKRLWKTFRQEVDDDEPNAGLYRSVTLHMPHFTVDVSAARTLPLPEGAQWKVFEQKNGERRLRLTWNDPPPEVEVYLLWHEVPDTQAGEALLMCRLWLELTDRDDVRLALYTEGVTLL